MKFSHSKSINKEDVVHYNGKHILSYKNNEFTFINPHLSDYEHDFIRKIVYLLNSGNSFMSSFIQSNEDYGKDFNMDESDDSIQYNPQEGWHF